MYIYIDMFHCGFFVVFDTLWKMSESESRSSGLLLVISGALLLAGLFTAFGGKEGVHQVGRCVPLVDLY